MALLNRCLRSYRAFLIWILALWLGGFTFYSAAVIPVLHDELGSPVETGFITQRVTDLLNLIGLATIAAGWTGVVMERRWGRTGRADSLPAILLLVVTSVCLVGLFVLHYVMDRWLEVGSSPSFYRLHRAYLWVSVVQWVANLGLMTCWSGVWEAENESDRLEESSSSEGQEAT